MALTAEQRNNIKRALGVAREMHAPPRVTKALIEAIGVESNYRDLDYGDRDSTGILQQRPSQGWGPDSESLETDVRQFLDRAIPANRSHKGSAGSLAQSVQRSGFPDRYDERSAEANRILGRLGRHGGGGSPEGTSQESPAPTAGNVPDLTAVRRQLLFSYLDDRHNPDALLQLAQGLNGLKGQQQAYGDMAPAHSEGAHPPHGGGHAGGAKKPWNKSKLFELFLNLPGGINADEGKRVPQGFVSGHTDHLHFAAPTAKVARVAKIAQKMGLNVREFEPYDKVDPVHTNGSFHYKNEAADISGDPQKLVKLSHKIARRYGL